MITGKNPADFEQKRSNFPAWVKDCPFYKQNHLLINFINDLIEPEITRRLNDYKKLRRRLNSIEKFSKNRWIEIPTLVIITTLLASLLFGTRWLGGFESAELFFYDIMMRMRPLEEQDDRITIITIDKNDVLYQQQNKMPPEDGFSISDEVLENLIKILFSSSNKQNPRLLGYDLLHQDSFDFNYINLVNDMKIGEKIIHICRHRTDKLVFSLQMIFVISIKSRRKLIDYRLGLAINKMI